MKAIASILLVLSLVGCASTQQKIVSSDVALPIASRHLCLACHSVDKKIVGPSFKEIAAKYRGQDVQQRLITNVRSGGSSGWGIIPMPPFPEIPDNDLKILVRWITQQTSPLPKLGDLVDSSQLQPQQTASAPPDIPALQSAWANEIRTKVRSNIVTPQNTPPNAKVIFSVKQLTNGEVIEVTLIQSSGFPEYDKATEKAIYTSSPLPKAPIAQAFSRHLVLTFIPQESPFSITEKNIEASKPQAVTLASLIATNTGANIVVFAYSNVSVMKFIRQLEQAGASNVQLLGIKQVIVCGRRVNRAEFKIDGDTSRLISPKFNEDENIRMVTPSGEEFQCNRNDISPENPNRHKDIAAYSKTVIDKIATQSSTKEEAELRDVGEQGMFSIGILANGNLENVEIIKSTGSRGADEEIVKRIKSASPFSPPPATAIGTSGIFRISKPFFYPKPK